MAYQVSLANHLPAVRYLESRGLTKEAAQRFRIGYVESPALGHDSYVGRIAIPYVTRAGVVTMRFRAMPGRDTFAKYLSLPEEPPRLYNPDALFRREDYIAICEGEFDTIATDTLAGVPAVGVAGTNAWRSHWGQLFRGYSKVFVIADSDEVDEKTGERAGEKLLTHIRKSIRGTIPIHLPEGHDANSFILEHGARALREKLGLE